MSTFIKPIHFNDVKPLLQSEHPLIAFPATISAKKGDKILLYEKKYNNHGGLVVGEAVISRTFSVKLNEERRVGPPKKLFRFWAETVEPHEDIVAGLDELGSFELSNYRKGSVLDWIWSTALIKHIKETDEWPNIETISRVTSMSPMKCWAKSDEMRKQIAACEHWLEKYRLISEYGEYEDAGTVATVKTKAYRPGRSLAEFEIDAAPRGLKLIKA